MSGAPALCCSGSENVGKVLAAPDAYDAAVLADLDHGEMTGVFHVATFQVGPKFFDFGA